jgi:hypothetical protein
MILDIDENDLKSVQDAIGALHKLRTRLEKNTPALRLNNVRFEKRLAAIQKEFEIAEKIFDSDISSIYQNSCEEKKYYVYVHCNPLKILNVKRDAKSAFAVIRLGLKTQPFYVGKGCGDRCYDLNRNEGHRKIRQMIRESNQDISIVKIAENISEAEALAIESKIIDILGLRSLSEFSFLVNLDEGQMPNERRSLYPKGANWLLNKNKLKLYNGVPKG